MNNHFILKVKSKKWLTGHFVVDGESEVGSAALKGPIQVFDAIVNFQNWSNDGSLCGFSLYNRFVYCEKV